MPLWAEILNRGQMPYAQDCAVRLRPPSPDKIPVMNGSVSTDGKVVAIESHR